ncbi:MAG: hypothetical protein ACP5XB_04020 [Isosphaeraceae bacterium]
MRRPALLAMALCVVFAPAICAAQEGSLSVRDIVRGLKAREAAIRNFTVKAEIKVKTRSRYTGRLLDSADVVTMCVDNTSGRFWHQKVGQVYNTPGALHGGQEFFSEVEETVAFDGERTMEFSLLKPLPPMPAQPGAPAPAKDAAGGTPPPALIGAVSPGRQESWVVDPRQFTTTFMHESFTKPMGEAPVCEVLGPQGPEGLVLVQCRGPEIALLQPDLQGRHRFWVDVGKGMAVTRCEMLNLRKGETKWITAFATRCDDLFEVEKGIWVPRKYWEVSYELPPGKPPELYSEISAALSGWAVNQELPPSRFKVAFPEGTLVRDGVLHRTYIARAVTDRSVRAAAEASQQMRDSFLKIKPTEVSDASTPRWVWVLGALAFAGVIALGVKVAGRLRNRRMVP